ncbi:hypothetical protein EC973_001576 [Apophysomyces ossiformis]|uniref:Dihydroxyacetone kinase n=1 Tax=Apophysomyces ossiformis TaxID=679940 RepID=A0A8H7BHQ2_9FUNG|nr:hypothetical protein EC973_001576 [Apophysomyces ossiformis]
MNVAKHLLNEPETLVSESLQGLCYAHPHLRWIQEEKVVYATHVDTLRANQVTLVAGGGSGHEPAWAGFVGDGMLTAAVCGHVFASPSASQVLAAIERVQSPHGTLVIVKNYTGDALNFGLAVERAKARGIKVDMIIVGDDVAVGRTKGNKVGRRGMAGTALVVKLAGAKAAQGATLDDVRRVGENAMKQCATLGMALDHCHVPGSSSYPQLGPDEIELGLGIHGEPGVRKIKMMPVKPLVQQIIDILVDQEDTDRSYLHLPREEGSVTPVVLLVNNYGGTPMIEFNVAVKEAVEAIQKLKHLDIKRVLAGPFVTSLNMPGISLTLLTLAENTDETLCLLDYPVHVAGWPLAPARSFSTTISSSKEEKEKEATTERHPTETPMQEGHSRVADTDLFASAIRQAALAVIEAEPEITHFDTVLGDGDCGQTLKTGAQAILDKLAEFPLHSASETILMLADTIENSVGGTSSAIYCIFLNALAAGLTHSSAEFVSRQEWTRASEHALKSLQAYTSASTGDRTMMDTLIPFVNVLSERNASVGDAVAAAKAGAESTRHMKAKLGRTSYVSDQDVEKAALPDAGAWGLAVLLTGMGEVLD